MLLLSNPHTYWLNVTNAGLGVAVCVVVLLLVLSVIQDVRTSRSIKTDGITG